MPGTELLLMKKIIKWLFSSKCIACGRTLPPSSSRDNWLPARVSGLIRVGFRWHLLPQKHWLCEVCQMDRKHAALLAEAKAKHAAERAAQERHEAEAVARGELLPRPPEPPAGTQKEGTFRAGGLTWQLEPATLAMTLRDAKSYASKIVVAGSGHWQLPTAYELLALYKAKLSSPVVAAYPGMNKGWYWSATPYEDGNTWCVNFLDGSTAGNIQDKPIAVRCLTRDAAQVPIPWEGNSSTETFDAVGLTWQREPARWQMDWEDAKSYAARLTLAGGGWRLPTLRELKALYKEKLSSPAIRAYPGMSEGCYWSASPSESDLHYIWAMYFRNGEVVGHGDTLTYGVRCVKPSGSHF